MKLFQISLIFQIYIKYSFQFQLKVSYKKYNNKNENNIIPKFRNLFKESTLNLKELELLTIPLCLGSSNLCYDFVIDTGSYLFWINEKFYSSSSSSSFIEGKDRISFNYSTGTINGIISKDVFSFKDNSNIKILFPIIIAKTENLNDNINGILGLSKDYDYFLLSKNNVAKRFMLIEELYIKNIIKQKIFEYKPINLQKGILNFGETEYNLNKYKKCTRTTSTKKYTSSDLIFFKYLWTCKLFDITNENDISIYGLLNLTMLDFNIQIVFDSAANVVLLSKEIYYYIIESYKKESKNNCEQFKDTGMFNCNKEFDIKKLPKFYIKLETFKLEISPEDVFIFIGSEEDINMYLLRILPKREGYSWIVGNIILKKYQIAYNYDDKAIYFYEGNLILFSKFYLLFLIICPFIILYFLILNQQKKVRTLEIDNSQEMKLI